jgi:copper chaperone NosL
MTKTARYLALAAALLLATSYALPLWRVGLVAPQYPEGLGMRIHINNVVGMKEYDLGSINGLNHYIGMKTIEPDSIPELKIMPFVLGVLVALGLATAATGKRAVLVTWASGLGLFIVAGLYDFWRWEYSYGHDLDYEHAIIKIPGMTYQPPLIGSKKLLNFTATSWPDSGAYLMAIAAIIITFLIWRSYSRRVVAH